MAVASASLPGLQAAAPSSASSTDRASSSVKVRWSRSKHAGTTADLIGEQFSIFGPVAAVELTGTKGNAALVHFHKPEHAEAALGMESSSMKVALMPAPAVRWAPPQAPSPCAAEAAEAHETAQHRLPGIDATASAASSSGACPDDVAHTFLRQGKLDPTDLLNTRGPGGITAMHWSVTNGRADVVRWLLEHEGLADRQQGGIAYVNIRADNQISPLWEAASKGHEACARLLLDASADIHAVSSIGTSVFSIAAQHLSLEFLKDLAARGANCRALNSNGKSAFDFAAKREDGGVAILGWLVINYG